MVKIVCNTGYDPELSDGERSVLLALQTGVLVKVWSVVIRRIVSGTWYSPVHFRAIIICSVSICWGRSDTVGWYPYAITTENVYPVPACRSTLKRK